MLVAFFATGNSEPADAFAEGLALPGAIDSIRRLVCEHFYPREVRGPELTVRTNRRSYVLPRQIAMYIARQLTGALQEIGRSDAPHQQGVESHDHAIGGRVCRADLRTSDCDALR